MVSVTRRPTAVDGSGDEHDQRSGEHEKPQEQQGSHGDLAAVRLHVPEHMPRSPGIGHAGIATAGPRGELNTLREPAHPGLASM